MTTPETKIIWERSDRLLSGATVAVRGVGLPENDEMRSAVAITVQVDAASCQVSEDGTVTATLLVGPGEAIGVSRWLREAAQSVEEVGPPLFDWEPSDPSTIRTD
ncbi:MAG: hypothetical protein QOE61_4073 [Micromonosporaceae bacterium]|jgi:hypothetical protein|nr:hypothetical protein [Micromonosporaceae bacterium]